MLQKTRLKNNIMKKDLKKLFGIEALSIDPFVRSDTENDNQLFKIRTENETYFLKEIPSHSKRDDLENIYQEFSKCVPVGFDMVLPIITKDKKYLFTVNDKEMMLYPFFEHKVIENEQVSVSEILSFITELITELQKIKLPEHPVKNYSNWFARGPMLLKRKIPEHKFITLMDEYINNQFSKLVFSIGNTHFDLNTFNVWKGLDNRILVSDFDNALVAAHAKDIFDLCSKFLTIKDQKVEIAENDFLELYKFTSNYVQNLTTIDVRYMLIRPHLGELFDPDSELSIQEISNRLDLFYEFVLSN